MSEREAQMVNAGVEVVGEALDDRRQLAAVRLHEPVAEPRGQRRRGGLIAGTGPDRDLGPLGVRRLAVEIAQPADQAALAQGPRKAGLNGSDAPRRPVGDGQQGIGQAAPFQIFEERRAAGGVLLRPRRQVEQDLDRQDGGRPYVSHDSGRCSRPSAP